MITAKEKELVVDIITGAAELLNRNLSKVAVMLFVKAIEDLPYGDISMAFSQSIQENKFFPTPADIRNYCGKCAVAVTAASIADQQAGIVVDLIRRIGYYGRPVFDDPITARLLSTRWSFRYLCDMTEEETKWFVKDFKAAYQGALELEGIEKNRRQIDAGQDVKSLAGGILKQIDFKRGRV